MANYLAAAFSVLLLAGGLYAALVIGLGVTIEESFISPRNTEAEASATPSPSPSPTATIALAATSTPEPPPPAPEPPQAAPNRANCGEIRGTQYQSDEERSWYLSNCLAEPNRANCDEIRGTPYLSTAERNWYLASCL